MKKICVPGTSLSVSRLTFGTAALHHSGSSSDQAAHVTEALTNGFTHFDTSPLYGFGEAERVLGDAFHDTGGITIATKVGLYPPGGCEQARSKVLVRKVAGKVWSSMSRALADLSVERARQSLEGSLQRLRRNHVDILFIHEPEVALLNTDEWQRWLETERERVWNIGVAGPKHTIVPLLSSTSRLASVIQTEDSLDRREADFMSEAGRQLQFTYGYLSGEPPERRGVGLLASALARNVSGSILISTRSSKRLVELARAAREQG